MREISTVLSESVRLAESARVSREMRETWQVCCLLLLVNSQRKCADITVNNTINFVLKLQSAFCSFETITVSKCCLIKLLP